jgi:hypothetical protein
MPSASIPKRPLSHTLALVALWIAFYASFTLFTPALLDDADSVHAEVAREMLLRHDWVTLYANGIRYLEKAPLLYWSMAASMGVSQMLGRRSPEALAVAARSPSWRSRSPSKPSPAAPFAALSKRRPARAQASTPRSSCSPAPESSSSPASPSPTQCSASG